MSVAESASAADSLSDLELFARHQESILDVLGVLGYQKMPLSLAECDELTRGWTLGDHWPASGEDPVSPEQQAALMEIFDSMGLVETVLPAKSNYDHVAILGGTALGNLRSAKYMRQLLETRQIQATPDAPIDILAGQRLREPWEDLNLTRILDDINQRGVADEWVRRESRKTAEDWHRPFGSEAELARLALVAVFGSLELTDARLRVGLHPRLDSIPHPSVAWKSFTSDSGQKFRVMNAAAVPRARQDRPRHTSSSSIAEWLRMAQPETGAELLLVNSNPHMQRTATDTRRVFINHGREDLKVETVGPGALPNSHVSLFLGEIGRIVYNATKASVLTEA